MPGALDISRAATCNGPVNTNRQQPMISLGRPTLFKHILIYITVTLFLTSISVISTDVEAGAHNKESENKLVCDRVRDKRVALGNDSLVREYSMLLLEASEKGCLTEAKSLLDQGALINVKDRQANTPVIRAAAAGQLEMLKYLRNSGGELDRPNLRGATALMKAVQNNRRKVTKWLLEQGVQVNVLTLDNEMPLSQAAFDGNIRLLKQLISAGADPTKKDNTNKSALIYASAKGFHPIVSVLLEAGADPNEIFINKTTALMWASGHTTDTPTEDAVKTVSLLLDSGADADLRDNRGYSALDYANQRDNQEVIDLLAQ